MAVSAQAAGDLWIIGWVPTNVKRNEEEHGDANGKEDLKIAQQPELRIHRNQSQYTHSCWPCIHHLLLDNDIQCFEKKANIYT